MLVREGRIPNPNATPARKRRCRNAVLLALGLAAALAPAVPASAALSTTPDVTWHANGRVYDVLRVGGRVYIAGAFTSVQSPGFGRTVARNHVAAFDAATNALVEDWAPNANGEVRALAASADGTRIYLGGQFTSVDGAGRARAAAVDATTGALSTTWRPVANSTVRALAVSGSTVYMGGEFVTVAGQTRNRLAAVDATTGALRSWAPSVTGDGLPAVRVRALKVSPDGSRIFVGGEFTKVSGLARNRIAAVSTSTGAVTSWAADALYEVIGLDATSTAVYAAVGGPGGGRAMAFDASTGARLWLKPANGDVQSVAFVNGRVHFGGHWELFDNVAQGRFVTLNPANGALDLGFAPKVNSGDPAVAQLGVWKITYNSSRLYIGGDFTMVSDQKRYRSTSFPNV